MGESPPVETLSAVFVCVCTVGRGVCAVSVIVSRSLQVSIGCDVESAPLTPSMAPREAPRAPYAVAVAAAAARGAEVGDGCVQARGVSTSSI